MEYQLARKKGGGLLLSSNTGAGLETILPHGALAPLSKKEEIQQEYVSYTRKIVSGSEKNSSRQK